MADSGKIALMLELQIAAGPALETIEKFTDAFLKVEQQVANVGKTIDAMAVNMKGIAKNMAEATEGSAEVTDHVTKAINELIAKHDILAQTRKRNGANINVLNMEELKALQELDEQIKKLSDEEQRAFNKELKGNKQLKDAFRDLGKAMAEEEKRMDKRNQALTGVFGTLVGTAGAAGKQVTELASGIFGLDASFDLMSFAVGLATVALNDFISAQDKFAKGNYKAAGSFNNLALDMSMYELTLAATSEAAGKAMEAVIGAGLKSEDMQKTMIPTVMKMSKAYGVSEEETAKFGTTMISMGAGLKNVTGTLEFASQAIAKAGLSSADATALIKKMTDSMWEFYTLTSSQDLAEKAGKDMAAFAVMARDANVDVNLAMDSLAKIQKGGADLVKLMGGAAMTGGDPTEMMVSSMQRIDEIMQQTSGMSGELKRTVVESLSGMTLAEATAIDRIVKKQKEKFNITGNLTEEHMDRIKEEIAAEQSLEEAYNNTFSSISGIMAETLIPIFKTLVTALSPFFMILNTIMVPFGVIVRIFREFMGVLQNALGSGRMKIFGMIIASLVLLRFQMGRLLITLFAFGGIFQGIKMLMDSSNPVVKALGYGLAILATVMFITYLRTTSLASAFGIVGTAMRGIASIAKATWGVMKLLPRVFDRQTWVKGLSFVTGIFKNLATKAKDVKFGELLLGPKGAPKKSIFDVFMGGLKSVTSATLGKLPLLGRLIPKAPTIPPVTPPVPTIPPAANAAKGIGFMGYMKAIKSGIMVFARSSMSILKGAATFMLSIAMIGAPILLLAGLASLMKVSAGDFIMGVAALTVGILAMKLLIPIIKGLGTGAAGAIKGAAIIAAIILLIGGAFLIAALGFSLMADALQKFSDMDIGKIAGNLLLLGSALVKFALASAIGLLGLIPLGLFIIGLGVAALGMQAALLLFPTKEFLVVAAGMQKFGDAVSKLANIGTGVATIKDVLSALKSVDGKGMEAMGAYTSQLEKLADIVGKIGAVDIYDSLAGKVINNEANFDKAANIIKSYADKVAVDIERMGGLTPGKAEPTKTAKNEVKTRVNVERDEKVLASLEKQTTVLKDIAKKDSGESTNKKLDELVQSVKELVDYHKRNAGTHPAAQW